MHPGCIWRRGGNIGRIVQSIILRLVPTGEPNVIFIHCELNRMMTEMFRNIGDIITVGDLKVKASPIRAPVLIGTRNRG